MAGGWVCPSTPHPLKTPHPHPLKTPHPLPHSHPPLQAFLLAAMKFHCYVRPMPVHPPPRMLRAAVEAALTFMAALTRKRRVASAMAGGAGTLCCRPAVARREIRWGLGWGVGWGLGCVWIWGAQSAPAPPLRGGRSGGVGVGRGGVAKMRRKQAIPHPLTPSCPPPPTRTPHPPTLQVAGPPSLPGSAAPQAG